mmetsp:Transcript_34673/g.99255  ORF Transcript_34673/g.99255 Transcript_34673/m.99255 type:complete len:536 (+) Transcript_34673:1563-3170(+)
MQQHRADAEAPPARGLEPARERGASLRRGPEGDRRLRPAGLRARRPGALRVRRLVGVERVHLVLRRRAVREDEVAGAPGLRPERVGRGRPAAGAAVRHAAMRGQYVRVLRLGRVGGLLRHVRAGPGGAQAQRRRPRGAVEAGVHGRAGGGAELLRQGQLRGCGLRVGRLGRLGRLQRHVWWRGEEARPRDPDAAERQGRRLQREGKVGGCALQHAAVRGLRGRGLGRLGRVVTVHSHLRPGLPRAAPGGGQVRERVRQARQRGDGPVRAVRGPGPVLPAAGLRGLGLGRVVLLRQQVLRRQRAQQEDRQRCRLRGRAVRQRVPQGDRDVQPRARRAGPRGLRGAEPAVPLQVRALGRLGCLLLLLRGRPAHSPATPRRSARPPGRGALRGRARRDRGLRHRLLQPDVPGLRLGRLDRLGRLLALRRPALPPPRRGAAGHRVRQALRPGPREGGGELHGRGGRRAEELLRVGAVVGGEPLRRRVRGRHEDAPAAAAGHLHGARGHRAPLRRRPGQSLLGRADYGDGLRPPELQPRV